MGIKRKTDPAVLLRVWIVGGPHGKKAHRFEPAALEPGSSPEVFEESLRLEAMCFKLLRCPGEKGLKKKIETDVSGVAGDPTPLFSVAESLYQRSVAAAGKAQNTTHLR